MNVPPLTGAGQGFEHAQAIRELASGATNSLGSCVLAASATETTVTDARVTTTCRIILVPTSANAAGSSWWLKSVADGSFKLGHASSAAVDKTFAYEIRRGDA